jgi:hypothetical protein
MGMNSNARRKAVMYHRQTEHVRKLYPLSFCEKLVNYGSPAKSGISEFVH